ncbi:hypothetical protein R6Q57_009611 [Mikania cordata]
MEKKRRMVGIWDVKHMFESSIIIFLVIGALATTAVYYVNNSDDQQDMIMSPPVMTHHNSYNNNNNNNVYDSLEGCDLFSGRWVHDKESYPLYKEVECPYIPGEFSCGKYGRTDFMYQQWRWQPHGCNLPRFNAKVLERLRGKRVIFIGDSVNRNQWLSMVCMLQSVIPHGLKKMQKVANVLSLFTFKAFEYNVSIDFYWAPLLVESNADHPSNHKRNDRVINIQSIEKHAKNWVNADILVFNSYLWWMTPTIKIMYGSFADSKKDIMVSNHDGYQMVLEKWSDWLANHINHRRTQSYFMSMTATHRRGVDWGKQGNENCLNETHPIMNEYFWESMPDLKMMRILESSLDKLKSRGVNVHLVNITQLTQYRKDAHPSIHRLFYSTLKAKQLSNPNGYADCTHWCLPGVPDTWNELLLAYILQRRK